MTAVNHTTHPSTEQVRAHTGATRSDKNPAQATTAPETAPTAEPAPLANTEDSSSLADPLPAAPENDAAGSSSPEYVPTSSTDMAKQFEEENGTVNMTTAELEQHLAGDASHTSTAENLTDADLLEETQRLIDAKPGNTHPAPTARTMPTNIAPHARKRAKRMKLPERLRYDRCIATSDNAILSDTLVATCRVANYKTKKN